ncbi:unnamed protein product [Paramecium octaurelia]|uniref:Uncharacterized protein n=1 Tax=Paramecium octaurelia TaxID=43137 RepID=A0A8S1TK81_PAROT|nr:unnamed protein product [Paramecium octaurelia]
MGILVLQRESSLLGNALISSNPTTLSELLVNQLNYILLKSLTLDTNQILPIRLNKLKSNHQPFIQLLMMEIAHIQQYILIKSYKINSEIQQLIIYI